MTPVQLKNFKNVQIDGIGVGLANAANPFLPVFLAHLGASNFQVGLLTSMPAMTGLVIALLVGSFLQTRRNIVPWFSFSRLLVIGSYALTGVATFVIPEQSLVQAVLIIWALATLPQTMVAVSFSVVMSNVAGPTHRYDLMSRRWSILGFTTAVTVAIVGQVLGKVAFPVNYRVVFLGLSLGGLISYYFSSHIELPANKPVERHPGESLQLRFKNALNLVKGEREFLRFSIQRFVFISGTMLSIPLFPLYYVREVQASDTWIGNINLAQTAVLLLGYFLWTQGTKLRGARFVLLWTTLGLAIYPALVSMTHQVGLIVLLAGLAGIFQAGLDLVFFDELMRTVPAEYSATFVSLAQSMQYFSAIFAPLIGTTLADHLGIGSALLVSAGLRFLGFALFAFWGRNKTPASLAYPAAGILPGRKKLKKTGA